jgi:hypothetical protein
LFGIVVRYDLGLARGVHLDLKIGHKERSVWGESIRLEPTTAVPDVREGEDVLVDQGELHSVPCGGREECVVCVVFRVGNEVLKNASVSQG